MQGIRLLAPLAVFAAVMFLLAGGCQRPAASPARSSVRTPPPASPRKQADDDSATGRDLYVRHCASCHGTEGDGQGVAARSLFPKPRDFRTSKFRLVSSASGVPTAADLDAVLVRGIPGSSMPSFRQLSATARGKATDEVLRLRREGARESLVRTLQNELQDEEVDAEELRALLDLRLTPGPAVAAPAFGEATLAMIRRGREIYTKQGCPRCHGSDGTGDTGLYLANEEGYPTRPRNLVREEFKGGHDPDAIYRRIWLGMPGTPMAANQNLSEPELVALVHYCRSLGRSPKWQLTNHERMKLVMERGFLSPGKTR